MSMYLWKCSLLLQKKGRQDPNISTLYGVRICGESLFREKLLLISFITFSLWKTQQERMAARRCGYPYTLREWIIAEISSFFDDSVCDFFALIKGVSMSILLSNINGNNIKQMILCVFLVEIKAHYSSLVSCSNMQSIFCPIKKTKRFAHHRIDVSRSWTAF